MSTGFREYRGAPSFGAAPSCSRCTSKLVQVWLTWSPLIGLAPLIWGLWTLSWFPTLAGLFVTVILKVWFCDRMAWIAMEWQADGHDWAELDQRD